MKKTLFCTFLLVMVISTLSMAQGFKYGKYGDDFLSVGGGARALGMGSSYVSMPGDVTSGYWNPAGLAHVDKLQIVFMHSERFSGIVGYDYGAVALPLQHSKGILAFSFYRQGVDGIKNTLSALNPDNPNNLPDPNTTFPTFGDNDYAFVLSLANKVNHGLSWGVSAKVLHSKIGPFAKAWGYSLDAGLLYENKYFRWGVNLMNIPSLIKFWEVNKSSLKNLPELGNIMPTGQNEIIYPTLKTGVSHTFKVIRNFQFLATADVDLRFENRRTYYINLGRMSIEPHLGGEVSFKDIASIRFGFTDFTTDKSAHIYTSPTLGAGIHIGHVSIDYCFTNFSGAASDLGFTHRISLTVSLPYHI